MMNEIVEEKPKIKNPKRVSAGKKGAEAKKKKAEFKKKEMESMKKENIQLKYKTKDELKITKDDDEVHRVNIYIPLCIIGFVGLGLYIYIVKIKKSNKQVAPIPPPKEDPFEFN